MPRESKDAGLGSADILLFLFFSAVVEMRPHSFECESYLQNNWDGGGKTNSVLLKVLSADQTDLLRNAQEFAQTEA